MNGYNFTQGMRNILEASRDESRRLKHEYVGTEHLLLGLLREDTGVVATVLQHLNANAGKIREQIEAVVQPGKVSVANADLPYTSRARKALELSLVEARDLDHNYVGGEHLLIGILREEKGIAAQVLNEAGIRLNAVREETVRLVKNTGNDGSSSYPPELDALVAAPDNHRLLLENEHVRVLDTTIPPGATTPLHTHRWPATHYIVSWSHFVRRDESGQVVLDTRQTEFAQKVPQVLWGTPLPAHTLENVGNTVLHVVSIELKHAAG